MAKERDKSSKASTIRFKFKSSTKGAHRYAEVDGDDDEVEFKEAAVGVIYIRQTAFGKNAPAYLEVKITPQDE